MSSGGEERGEEAAAKKLVKALKDIADRPLAEVLAALRDCRMDPGQAVVHLLQGKLGGVDKQDVASSGKKDKADEDRSEVDEDSEDSSEADEDSASSTHDLDLPSTSSDELPAPKSVESVNVTEQLDDGHGSTESLDKKKQSNECHALNNAEVAAPSGKSTGKKRRRKGISQGANSISIPCKLCKGRDFSSHVALNAHKRAVHDNDTA